jgi:hypothetical protein
MKWLLVVLMAAGAALAQQQPSPAEMARSSRRQAPPKPAKVYDNLPTTAPITVLGAVNTPEAATPDARPDDQASPDPNAPNKETKPKTDDDAAKKLQEQWHSKLGDQRKEISTLQRELDILQREFRLRQAALYADAGNSLRDPAKWAADDRQYQQQITEKGRQLDVAKQKLEDLREQARKAGVPATATD